MLVVRTVGVARCDVEARILHGVVLLRAGVFKKGGK